MLFVMLELWCRLPKQSWRAAHFVKHLGFCNLAECWENPASQGQKANMAFSMLKAQNWIPTGYVNSPVYTALAQLVDFMG